jgi:hypothetical protein
MASRMMPRKTPFQHAWFILLKQGRKNGTEEEIIAVLIDWIKHTPNP